MIYNLITMQLLKHYGLLGKMPNEHIRVRISQSSNYNLAPAPKKDKRKHANIIKNASDGTMSFMVWSVAGTVLVACSGSTLIANGTNDGSGGGAGVCDAVVCLKEEGPSVRLGPTAFGLPAPQGEDSLRGVYIETGVGEVGTEAIDVMFRNGGDLEDDAGDVPLETATVDDRGVPTIIPAGFQNSITVEGTNFYFVSAENLELLVLNPNNDYEGDVRDFKIRYYAYDSADEAFADTTATLAGASALDVAFEADDDPVTAVALVLGSLVSVAEDTTARTEVARLMFTDPDGGSPGTLELVGTNHEMFQIDGNVLYLRANQSLDFETLPTLNVRVQRVDDETTDVDETTIGVDITVSVTDVDEEATAIALGPNPMTSLAEDTTARTEVARLIFTDPDGGSPGTPERAGTHAGMFEIVGNVLYLRADQNLDFETLATLNVRVQLQGNPDVFRDVVVTVTNVDEDATAIALSPNPMTRLAEDTNTSSRIEIARLMFTDPDGGSPGTPERAGTHAGMFEIDGGVLYLIAGTNLDHETLPTLTVRVQLQGNPDVFRDVVVTVTDVDEEATAIALTATAVTTVAEGVSTRMKVADIVITDEDGGQFGTLELAGTNANLFDIDLPNLDLYLKAGEMLDFETLDTLPIRVQLMGDPSVSSPNLDISITNVDEGDASFGFTSNRDIDFPVDGDTLTVALDSSDPDGNGNGGFDYLWQRSDADGNNYANISGATNATYETIEADEGNTLRVVVSYIDGGGFSETVTTSGVSVLSRLSSTNEISTLDLAVTEDDAADNTARGVIRVTEATSPIAFSGGTTTGTSQVFNGIYGQLIVDGDGNWTYLLDNLDTDTNELNAGPEGREIFTVIIGETGGAMRTISQQIIITVTGVDDDATAIALTGQVINSLAEDAAVPARMKVADIDITDEDRGSPGTLERAGRDADEFEIDGGVLYLKRGASLDYEDADTLEVRVQLNEDPSVGADLTIDVTNVNEGDARFDVTSDGDINAADEGDVLSVRLDSSDLDGDGVFGYRWQRSDTDGNIYSDISGATRDSYTVTGDDVGTILRVVISYTDGGGYDEEVIVPAVSFPVTGDDLATAIVLTGQVNSLAEGTTARMKVADIAITDDDDGLSGTLDIIVTDANIDSVAAEDIVNMFEITGSGLNRGLYLKSEQSLDFEALDTFPIRVQLREDPSVGADLTINVTNVDEGDASFDVTSDDDIDFPVEGDELTVALDPSNHDPDGNGNGGFDYQWQRDDDGNGNFVPITGATNPSYTIDTADEGNSLRVVVSYTDGGGTDEEVTTSGVSVLPPLSITNEAVRAFVIVNGIEFRINADRSRVMLENYGLTIQAFTDDIVSFTSVAITVLVNTRTDAPANPFSQANINRIFNAENSGLPDVDLVAIILEEDASALIETDWDSDATNHRYAFSPPSTTLDLAVTEDDAADETARGFIQVTQATSPITFSGGTEAGPYQIFNGTYGRLIVDGDGNWTYMLDNEDIDTNTLSAGQEVTETTFNVIISETGGAMRPITQMITITVTGADDVATAIALTGQAITSLAEDADVSARMKVADIGITDNDGGLSGTLDLAGRDAGKFQIDGGVLYLRQDASLNYEDAQTLEVRVQLREEPSVRAGLTINVTNVDEEATAIALTATAVTTVAEGTTARMKVADIVITDEDGGQFGTLELAGINHTLFEIDLPNLDLYLKAGQSLDFETLPTLAVRVQLMGDSSVGANLTINVTNVDEGDASFDVTSNRDIDFLVAGDTLTVALDPSNPDPDGNGEFDYQWQRDGVSITGATSASYTIDTADEGDTLRVVVTYTDGGGTNEEVTTSGVSVLPSLAVTNEISTLDLAVTEDDAADNTASGSIQVTQATSPIAFSGGTTTGTSQVFNGIYGQLIVDGDGNWTYTLDNDDIDTNGLSAGQEGTETFNVIINETGAAMRATTLPIIITATGADDFATAIALTGQVINSLAEDANVSARMKVADIGITDGDGGSPGTLELAGTGADEFEIDGGVLYLKRGASLDYEDADTLEVRVQLNEDPDIGAGLTIDVTNVDEGEARFNVTSDGDINVPVAGDELTVALASSDLDGDGNGGFAYRWQRSDADGEIYSDISGATMDSYTITGGDMGTILRVVISYTDGGGYDEEVTISAAAVRVAGDDLATAIAFSNQVNSLAEDADVSARMKVADITITDDDDGLAGTLERAGRDADKFEIIGTELYLRQGAILDHEQADTLEVRVQVRENTSVGAGLTIDVTDADDGDASFDVTSNGDINFPVEGDVLTVALDTSNPDPDGNGNGGFDYQWQRDDDGNGNFVPITGATNASYTITEDDEGNSLRVVVSYTDGSGTDEEVTISGVSVLPPLSITNEAVRAFVIVNGIEFRVNAERSQFLTNNYEIDFQGSSTDNVEFTSAITVFVNSRVSPPANPFSQANINRIFNERGSAVLVLDLVAIILEEDASGLTRMNWNEAGNNTYRLSPASTTLDLAVTEDDAADNTARGFLQVTQATSSITFSGGTAASPYQIFNGRYGQLIVDGDGNWTYVLDNEDIDTNELLAGQEVTETFNVIISETGGAMRTITQPIIIKVTGASEFATAIALTNPVTSLAEDANVSARMKVADISITDNDGGSPGTLERAGRDAGKFEIDGGVLYLRRDASLDYEDADTLEVRVQLREDTSVRTDLTIDVTNVDEGEARFDVTSDGDINVPVAGDELTATLDPSNPDPDGNGPFTYRWQRSDADGNNYSDISGATMDSYTITGGDMGTILRVVISYTDGGGYDEEVIVSAAAVRVAGDDLATAIAFTNQVITDLAEDANVSAPIKVADIDITDEDRGLSGTLELDGRDADKFQIIGTGLYLRQGARLDYEQADTLEVRVRLRENTSINDNLTINVTNADDGDASFDVTSDGDINIPVAGDVLTVAPDTSDPDGNGVFTYQWQRDDGDGNVVPIAGATSTSYTITEDDEGNALTVAASYTDGGGFSETVTTSRVAVPLFVLPTGPEDGEPITTQVIAPSINFRATGTTNAELIRGSNGNDFISTRGGDDVVIGGVFHDEITLGTGDEQAGAETIIYRFEGSVQTFVTSRITMRSILVSDLLIDIDGRDQIFNFEYGVDKLILVDTRSDDGDPINSLSELLLAENDSPPRIDIGITGTKVTGLIIRFTQSTGSINITFADDDNRPIFDPEDMTGRSIHEHVKQRAPGVYELNDDVLANDALIAEVLFGGEENFHVGSPDILPNDLDIMTGLDFL